ncbi:hypothetical protein M885DRAFT_574256 [Pelagophyceae sp. CCMP2097]|nr:hypothetical protein M885DRAFT_574256 [Pelagophyceae sp. CCMP2097]
MFSDAPLTGPYSPPCSSRLADGVVRGAIIGVAWSAAFRDESGLLPKSAAAPAATLQAAAAESLALRARAAAFLVARNAIGFAGFLGTFNAVSCSLEYADAAKARGRRDLWNQMCGGVAAGLFVSVGQGSPRQVATSALTTGLITGAIYHFCAGGTGSGVDTD